MSGKGGKIAGAGRKRERGDAVRAVSVRLTAAEDACLTRLEVSMRLPGAEVLRRALLLLATAHVDAEDAPKRRGPRAVVV